MHHRITTAAATHRHRPAAIPRITPAAALAALQAPLAGARIILAAAPVVALAVARQVAPTLAVLPTTAAIHQAVVLAELHRVGHRATPVAVITAAPIMACIDARNGMP